MKVQVTKIPISGWQKAAIKCDYESVYRSIKTNGWIPGDAKINPQKDGLRRVLALRRLIAEGHLPEDFEVHVVFDYMAALKEDLKRLGRSGGADFLHLNAELDSLYGVLQCVADGESTAAEQVALVLKWRKKQ